MSARAIGIAALTLACSFCPDLAVAQQPASGPESNSCDKFSWPVDRERGWFADKDLPRRPSGARLRRIDRAVELSLETSKRVDYFLPPKVALKPHSFGGNVTFFGVPRPGLYQVTLSSPASVEVFENGVRLEPIATTTAEQCPGVAESVRFALAPGDLVLVEIFNSGARSIKVAFEQAPPSGAM